MKRLAFLLAFFAAATARSQSGAFEIGGYVKDLISRSTIPNQAVAYDNLLHARLNTAWYPAENLRGVLELRARAYYGDAVAREPDFADRLGQDAGFGTLGVVLWDEHRSAAYAEIDRLYVNWAPARWQLTAGRQRIAWGTNLVWNPIDLFNPQSVLDFDYEERPAVDALRVQYYTGDVSSIELALKPGTVSTRAITAAQLSANAWDYDFRLLGGRRADEYFAGAAWAGDIAGGGFRGEVLAAEVPLRLRSPRALLVSAAVSGDYTLPNSMYIHTELLYANEGAVHNAAVARGRAVALGLLSPARWSVYQQFGYNISALLRADIFAIWNPSDRSFVVVPSASWSAATNLDLTFLALFFSGRELTEFGGYGTALYARAKWSF